jgi:hypothetical protein
MEPGPSSFAGLVAPDGWALFAGGAMKVTSVKKKLEDYFNG